MSPRYLIWALALWPASASAADWSMSLSGGIATIAGESEQPFASVTLYRYFGAGFVRAGVAWFDGEGAPDMVGEASSCCPVSSARSSAARTMGGGITGANGASATRTLAGAGPTAGITRVDAGFGR